MPSGRNAELASETKAAQKYLRRSQHHNFEVVEEAELVSEHAARCSKKSKTQRDDKRHLKFLEVEEAALVGVE